MKALGWGLLGLGAIILVGLGVNMYIKEQDREKLAAEIEMANDAAIDNELVKKFEIYARNKEAAKKLGEKIQETLDDEEFDMSKPIDVNLEFDEDGLLIKGDVNKNKRG